LLYLASLASFIGCHKGRESLHIIPVEFYTDTAENIVLAHDLSLYEQSYFAHMVTGYQKPTPVGVLVGSYVDSVAGIAGLKLYFFPDESHFSSSSIEAVVSNFEQFIPVLAKAHVSKKSLFKQLQPVGKKWLESYQSNSFADMVGNKHITEIEIEKMDQYTAMMLSINGPVENVEFEQAQYYEAYNDYPESVLLYYQVTYKNVGQNLVRLSLDNSSGEWIVYHFQQGARYQAER